MIMKLFLEIAFKNFLKFFLYKKYRIYYWLLFRYGHVKRHQISIVKFFGYKIAVADHLSFIFQYREIFLEESYKFFCNNSRPIIVDCGSNIGMSVLYYKKTYPGARIYCIEADKEIAKLLKSNIDRNRFEDVSVIAKAAWINNDGVYFNSDGADGGNIASKGTFIESINFNEILSEFDNIDFIKIDIEGAEKILVPNCINNLSRCNNIFLEYHTSGNEKQNLAEILNKFEELGYRYFIKNENKRESPFVNKSIDKAFDMQLNIFLYK